MAHIVSPGNIAARVSAFWPPYPNCLNRGSNRPPSCQYQAAGLGYGAWDKCSTALRVWSEKVANLISVRIYTSMNESLTHWSERSNLISVRIYTSVYESLTHWSERCNSISVRIYTSMNESLTHWSERCIISNLWLGMKKLATFLLHLNQT